jgi:hypothetical protein
MAESPRDIFAAGTVAAAPGFAMPAAASFVGEQIHRLREPQAVPVKPDLL